MANGLGLSWLNLMLLLLLLLQLMPQLLLLHYYLQTLHVLNAFHHGVMISVLSMNVTSVNVFMGDPLLSQTTLKRSRRFTIGELVGGAAREERLDVLTQRCAEMNIDPSDLWWYLDTRRYGTVPHGGFGLGFERLIMFVTGIENIRDVIPFPRVPGHAEF